MRFACAASVTLGRPVIKPAATKTSGSAWMVHVRRDLWRTGEKQLRKMRLRLPAKGKGRELRTRFPSWELVTAKFLVQTPSMGEILTVTKLKHN